MGKRGKWEYFKRIYERYRRADAKEKGKILDEFCKVCGYNRKYAIQKLNGEFDFEDRSQRTKRQRQPIYGSEVMQLLLLIWTAAGFICSVRLKEVIRLWLPWIRRRFDLRPEVEIKLLRISARQIDRRLRDKKRRLRQRLYGRTKPGSLLKHQIPIRTEHWDVEAPGYTEIDLISHSGNYADGEFAYSVNQTDILTTWVETRAILGKGERAVVAAIKDMAAAFRFRSVVSIPIMAVNSLTTICTASVKRDRFNLPAADRIRRMITLILNKRIGHT